MGFLSPNIPKTPPVPDPEPVEISDETSEEIRQEEARKRRARRSRASTVITGQFSPEITGKKSLLG